MKGYFFITLTTVAMLLSAPGMCAQSTPEQINAVLEKYARKWTVESPQYADCLMWGAMECARNGDAVQSYRLLNKSINLFELYGDGSFNGRDTLHEIMRLDVLAAIEYNERSYYAARRLKESLSLKKDFFGEKSGIYLNSVLDLSRVYAERFDYRKSEAMHNLGYNSYVGILRSEFCSSSENDRADYWDKASGYLYKTIDLADRYAMSRLGKAKWSLAGMAYNSLLLSKGILLNASVNFEAFVSASGNDIAIETLAVKKKLAAEGLLPREVSDSLDYAILRYLKDAGHEYDIPLLMVTWKDVQKQLSDDDLAIEFYRNSSGGYGALLLRSKWNSPRIVKLKSFIESEEGVISLEQALSDNPFDYYGPSRSHDLWIIGKAVWDDGLLKYFPKTDKGRVFFATDGAMQTCGIEYLPIVDPSGRDIACICDYYDMRRLSSTRELITRDKSPRGCGSVVFGGLNYSPSVITEADSGGVRAVSAGGTDGRRIPFLKETISEADSLGFILNLHDGFHTMLYLRNDGTEERFKSLNGEGKRVIHVATHGFYYPIKDSLNYRRFLNDDSPMTRSGLFMAGAQEKFRGGDVPPQNDGILTSRELSVLNLSGLELVSLSACETGRGDIGKDGVFGLQRAFKMANAQCILMSLWKVDDVATRFLMTEFYRNWLSGCGKQESLRRAKDAVRKIPDWSNPRYWAAFILLDDID